MPLARLYAAFPLTRPRCGAERRSIAFITAVVDVRAILARIGEPATPPRIASARGTAEMVYPSRQADSGVPVALLWSQGA
jgi:hypothetical protein